MNIGKLVSVKNAEHYIWGQNNDGWHLLKNDDLSVIEERMIPNSSETLHFHKRSQQVFYILSGEATFETGDKIIHLNASDSLHVPPEVPHKIYNNGILDLRFIVISSPPSHGDRFNV